MIRKSDRRGIAAVVMVVLLVVVGVMILGTVHGGARDQDLSARRLETVQALYATEAGVNMAIRELMVDIDEDLDGGVGSISDDAIPGNDPTLGIATFTVTAVRSGTQTTLTSNSSAGQSRRTAEVVTGGSSGGGGTITLDNTSSATTNGTTLAFSHTIGAGSNRLLIVGASVEATLGNSDLTGNITYNGVALTKAIDRIAGTSYDMNTEIWYMLDAALPAAGTYTVSIPAGGAINMVGGAASFFGAAQQPPEATAANDDGESGAGSIQTNITTLTDNAWIFDVVGSGNAMSGFTPDPGQTERWDLVASSSRGAGSTEEIPSATTETQGWTCQSSSNRLSHVLAAFAPGETQAFAQDSGPDALVSMEAENFDLNTPQGSHTWNQITTPVGYSSTAAMRAEPDSGTNNDTGYVANSPRLDFTVDFVATGTHYVWIHGYKTGGSDDSCHVGLDGVGISTSDRISNFASNNLWLWTSTTMDSSSRATFNVGSTGVHTVNVWMREDGFRFDKIVLTTNAAYTPVGDGPLQSPRTGSVEVTSWMELQP